MTPRMLELLLSALVLCEFITERWGLRVGTDDEMGEAKAVLQRLMREKT